MKRTKEYLLMLLAMFFLSACSNHGDEIEEYSGTRPVSAELYAIVKEDGAQLIDIVPEDYVLTLDNIISVNPETGEFKMMNTEKMDSKANPVPTQYVIQFYSMGSFLFQAKLTDAISSFLPFGLTFCHYPSHKAGMSTYTLGFTTIELENGTVEGSPTKEQKEGIQRLYSILKKAGKTTNTIEPEQ